MLLSGGPDSKTLARIAHAEGPHLGAAVYVRTGSPTDDEELAAAQKTANELGITLKVVDVSDVVRALGVKRLMPHAGADIAGFGIVFVLSAAIAIAKSQDLKSVLVALHKDDAASNSNYSQAFIDKINAVAEAAGSPKVYAPLLTLTKAQVIERGLKLGVDYTTSWSCSESTSELQCGVCGACVARRAAFKAAGVVDATKYECDIAAEESVMSPMAAD